MIIGNARLVAHFGPEDRMRQGADRRLASKIGKRDSRQEKRQVSKARRTEEKRYGK
jgi:hypothetical protein